MTMRCSSTAIHFVIAFFTFEWMCNYVEGKWRKVPSSIQRNKSLGIYRKLLFKHEFCLRQLKKKNYFNINKLEKLCSVYAECFQIYFHFHYLILDSQIKRCRRECQEGLNGWKEIFCFEEVSRRSTRRACITNQAGGIVVDLFGFKSGYGAF